MTLDQLKMFKAVVEEGGVAAAARRLNKTQPALSSAISRLEAELSVSLFDRSAYRLVLSEAGQVLFKQVQVTLNQVGTIEKNAAFLSMGHEPTVVMSLEVLVPTSTISGIIRDISKSFPATQISLTTDVMGGALEKLSKEAVDIAIGPRIGAIDGVENILIANVKLVAVAAASIFSEITIEKLEDYPQIVIPETTQRPSERNYAMAGGPYKIYVADFIIKKQLLVDGVGWGFMPLHLVEEGIKNGQLVVLDCVRKNRRSIDIYSFRLVEKNHGPVVQKIWDELNGQCRSKIQ